MKAGFFKNDRVGSNLLFIDNSFVNVEASEVRPVVHGADDDLSAIACIDLHEVGHVITVISRNGAA
ncbi:hypothetical protein SDC9_212665 [bioreactor metagenome]|uniref:Uncharacterized protein n=1 Tax=bioreactor metagenome TaxID=1076179 RepID=A0A645JNG7_9ZZZZ